MATVNVIHAGDVRSFDAMLFPEQSPQTSSYIQSQLNSFSSTLTEIGKQFVESSKALYEKINDSNAIRLAKAAVRMAKGMFHPNMIIPLETLEDVRAAQPMMQRYIMAEPTLREQYHRQLVDGFSDTYADVEPKRIGEKHYDYRRVMDGIVIDDEEEGWIANNYFEDLRGDDRDLDLVEQRAILKTWDIIRMALASEKDPSDPFALK